MNKLKIQTNETDGLWTAYIRHIRRGHSPLWMLFVGEGKTEQEAIKNLFKRMKKDIPKVIEYLQHSTLLMYDYCESKKKKVKE